MQASETQHIFCYTVNFGLSKNAGVIHEIYLLPSFQDVSASPPSCIVLFVELVEYDGQKAIHQARGFMADMFPETAMPQYEYLQSYPWAPIPNHHEVPVSLKEELQRCGILGPADEVCGEWSRAPIKGSFQILNHLMLVGHVTEPTVLKMEKITQAMQGLAKKARRVAQQ